LTQGRVIDLSKIGLVILVMRDGPCFMRMAGEPFYLGWEYKIQS